MEEEKSLTDLSISAQDVRLRLFKYVNEVITERQYELLDLVLAGKTIDEMAEEMEVKRSTIIQHFHGVKKRFMPFIFKDRLIASLLAVGLNDNKMWIETKEDS